MEEHLRLQSLYHIKNYLNNKGDVAIHFRCCSELMFIETHTVDIQISKNSLSEQDFQSPKRFG